MYKKYLFSIIVLFSLQACSQKKAKTSRLGTGDLKSSIEQFVNCHNTRDQTCLINLYHKNYESLSPINKPESLPDFIKETLQNLQKNNFEVAIQLKEIEAGINQAYVSMNWQLKAKGTPKEDDPFANVQRLDIWKKDAANNWRILRTIIYNEKAF